jgi:uncharacterized membrane protein
MEADALAVGSRSGYVPFVAILQGRNSLKIGELGWWPLVLALIVYGLFLYFHKILFGGSPWPM